MGYAQDFQRNHDEATSQNAKDWLLVKAVMREVLRCGGKAMLVAIFYAPLAIIYGLGKAITSIAIAIIGYPSMIWDEGLRDTINAIHALRYLRTPTLPVNRKPLPEKG